MSCGNFPDIPPGMGWPFVDAETGEFQSETVNAALLDKFNVHALMWDGSAYPPRREGQSNLFIGGPDPGLLAEPEDFWANPDSTTIAEVVSEAEDPSSDLYKAMLDIADRGVIIPMRLLAPATLVAIGASPNRIFGTTIPDTVSTVAYGVTPVPPGWNTARVRYQWVRTAAGSGAVRLSMDATPVVDGSAPTTGASVTSDVAVAAVNVIEETFGPTVTVTAFTSVSVTFGRIGSSGSDTFAGDIYLVNAMLERVT